MMDRDDQDLGQWRIKVVMEEMNLPCSSSSVWLLEDGERTHNIQYCNEKKAEVFYSHEHLIVIKFKNKVNSKEQNFQIQLWENSRPNALKMMVALEQRYRWGYLQSMFVEEGLIKTMESSPVRFTPPTISTLRLASMILCMWERLLVLIIIIFFRAPKKKRIALTCDYFDLSTKCDGHCGDHNGDRTYFQV